MRILLYDALYFSDYTLGPKFDPDACNFLLISVDFTVKWTDVIRQ